MYGVKGASFTKVVLVLARQATVEVLTIVDGWHRIPEKFLAELPFSLRR